LNTPRHRNTTLLATALTALDRCRNGTTDSFSAVNVTGEDAATIIEGFLFPDIGNSSANKTVKRALDGPARMIARATTWPCPTVLYNGAESAAGRLQTYGGLSNFLVISVLLLIAIHH